MDSCCKECIEKYKELYGLLPFRFCDVRLRGGD